MATLVFIGGHELEVADDYATVVDLIKNTQQGRAPDPERSVPAHWFPVMPAGYSEMVSVNPVAIAYVRP
jgi:hypothetical protein